MAASGKAGVLGQRFDRGKDDVENDPDLLNGVRHIHRLGEHVRPRTVALT